MSRDGDHYTVLVVFASRRLGRFVMARHRDRGWELPGGRVEPGEGPIAAARREWTEETGLPLAAIEPLVRHARPTGDIGHVFLGAVEDDRATADEVAAHVIPSPEDEEKIQAVRFVDRIDDVAPLAFPDDPYAAVAEAIIARAAEDDTWVRRPEEPDEAFVARLVPHGHAPGPGHRVVPHPSRSASSE